MAHEKLRPQYFFDEAKIEQLKQIAPECFEDGKINFETLKQNLGDWAQDEEDPELEHFGLFWPGKRDARKVAALPPEGTLEPVWGEGLKADGTPDTDGTNDSKNIFIEGENLEVLKLLQKSYAGKIKMIYIDPPYNTGNDFVYDDDFTEPLQEYLRRTGQVDEEGKALTSNKRSDGRFHSKWLSMMYPRLRLARNLLREDGVIFVSIDDNEVHNLKIVLAEIFGEENFIGELIWKKKYIGGKHARHFVDLHEYVLVFAKDNNDLKELLMERPTEETEKFEHEDEYFTERGKFYIRPLKSNLGLRKTLIYPICLPDNSSIETQWMVAKDTFEKLKTEGRIVFKQKKDGTYNVYRKYYEKDNDGSVKVPSLIDSVSNADGKVEIKELFNIKEGREIPFENPKPTGLLKYFIKPSTADGDIILDFFAGSGTTANAILDLNQTDEIIRKYICVQIPELVDEKSEAFKAGFKTISEISMERIRRVSKNIHKSKEKIDLGFKALSLGKSNYKSWKNFNGSSTQQLEIDLEQFNNNPLREGYSKDGLLTEIMLMEGFTLCSSINSLTEIKDNTIKKVTSEYCQHHLLVCLDEKIKKVTIEALQLGDEDIFICLDSAISTEDKLRLSDKGLIKTI